MKISKNNYEAFLLDLLEGRLNAAEHDLLKAFVRKHPELGSWEELTEALPVLSEATAVMPEKTAIRVPEVFAFASINELNYNDWFISFHEGLLNNPEQQMLETFLELNKFLQEEFESYAVVRFEPDYTLSFPDKKAIKKGFAIIGFPLVRAASVAASILLLVTAGWWWLQVDQSHPTPIQPILSMQPKSVALQLENERQSKLYLPERNTAAEIFHPNTMEAQETALAREVLAVLPSLSKKNKASIHFNERHASIAQNQSVENRLLLASIIEEATKGASGSSKSPIARIVQRNLDDVTQIISPVQDMAQSENLPNISKGGFSLWNLAEVGINTYNILADKDLQLVKAHDEQGRVKRIKLQSDRVMLSQGL